MDEQVLYRSYIPSMNRRSGGAVVIRAPMPTCFKSIGIDCSAAAEVFGLKEHKYLDIVLLNSLDNLM